MATPTMANFNHQCQQCGRQFVLNSQRNSEDERERIKKLLLERISLCGTCRVMDVSLRWLLNFIAEIYESLPDDLNVQPPREPGCRIQFLELGAEADEMWSFVGSKANKQRIWIALDIEIRQVNAFYVDDRSRKSAQQLWKRIPRVYRERANFYTDDWIAYKEVIPAAQHQVCAKSTGHTNRIERFNCTLRQRVSRLLRAALSSSKSS